MHVARTPQRPVSALSVAPFPHISGNNLVLSLPSLGMSMTCLRDDGVSEDRF